MIARPDPICLNTISHGLRALSATFIFAVLDIILLL